MAILLAAGESTRMGRLKQLLPWAGTTLIDWQIGELLEAGVDEVIVVLGAEHQQVAAAVTRKQATAVVNSAYREGRASSLRVGAAAFVNEPRRIVVLSVDQPRPAWVTRRLLDAGARAGRGDSESPLAWVPGFGGHRGHPIVLNGSLLAELFAVDEATIGLRAVMERHADRTIVVPVTPGPAPFDLDLNTPEDYSRALASFDNGGWPEP